MSPLPLRRRARVRFRMKMVLLPESAVRLPGRRPQRERSKKRPRMWMTTKPAHRVRAARGHRAPAPDRHRARQALARPLQGLDRIPRRRQTADNLARRRYRAAPRVPRQADQSRVNRWTGRRVTPQPGRTRQALAQVRATKARLPGSATVRSKPASKQGNQQPERRPSRVTKRLGMTRRTPGLRQGKVLQALPAAVRHPFPPDQVSLARAGHRFQGLEPGQPRLRPQRSRVVRRDRVAL